MKRRRRSFTREFKLAALARMAEADTIVALAQEPGIERKLLYCWRDQYAAGGAGRLRRAGRPGAVELVRNEAELAARVPVLDVSRQIAALERKVGRQQFELDFFRAALRQVRARRRSSGNPGETASTR